jgi:RNA polymerase sigma-32 factor
MTYVDDTETRAANFSYIRKTMKSPMLKKEREFELARRWRDEGDEKALHEMVESYGKLVVSVASKFKFYGLPLGDLIQEGQVGLMEAANRFDPERDIRFSTYATWWVRAAIQDYVLRNWSIVRTGTTAAQKSLFFNLRRLKAKIENKKQGVPLNDNDREDIANELNVSMNDLGTMEARLFQKDQSLNIRITEDADEEWQSFLVDEAPDPEEITIGLKDGETRSELLNKLLGELPEREQIIIRERHLRHKSVTLEKLGKNLGISKERVRQLEKRAFEKLRDTMPEEMESEALYAA